MRVPAPIEAAPRRAGGRRFLPRPGARALGVVDAPVMALADYAAPAMAEAA